MFIDFLTLQLIDLVIALALLIMFFVKYMNDDPKKVVPGFLLTGFVGIVTSVHQLYTWPLPSSYNIAFAEPMFLFGVLLFGAGIAIQLNWDLLSIGVFAFVSGIVAVIIGIGLISREMTRHPVLSGIGFIATGLTGLLFGPAYMTRQSPMLRYIAAVAALIALVVWAITGFGAYFSHLEGFAGWQPLPMR